MSKNNRYNLNRLSYFVAIVEERTITAAADRLGLSKAVVSKHLQLLEHELGVTLLVRNTRHIHPTEAGQAFYLSSKEVLIQAEQAFDSILEVSKEPAGRIRVTATVDFGSCQLAPLIAKFSNDYPQIEVELILSDEQIDIVEHRFDLAFRIGWLKDSSNRTRKLSEFSEVVVCEPKTAKKFSVKKPEDLATLPFFSFQGMPEKSRVFTQQSKRRKVALSSRVKMNVTSALRTAVLSSHCFTIVPNFIVSNDLAGGKRVQLLPEWQLRKGGIYIVSPPSPLRTQAVRLFLERANQELSTGK